MKLPKINPMVALGALALFFLGKKGGGGGRRAPVGPNTNAQTFSRMNQRINTGIHDANQGATTLKQLAQAAQNFAPLLNGPATTTAEQSAP